MAEIFLGDLSEVKFFDILKPLLIGKKTGKLSCKGDDNADLYLASGNIIHAKTTEYSGEYAFFAVMGWKKGRATFDPSEVSPEKTITIPTEQLLLYWSSKKMDWDKIREMIPSTDTVFRLAIQKNGEDRTINADQWNIVALSNGVRSISEIAKSLSWDELKTVHLVHQLCQAGLMEKVDIQKPFKTSKKFAGENFFVAVEGELRKLIGPVAPIVIGDKLSEFGETKESLTQDKLPNFVKSIEEEIPGEAKKKEFVKSMKTLFPMVEL